VNRYAGRGIQFIILIDYGQQLLTWIPWSSARFPVHWCCHWAFSCPGHWNSFSPWRSLPPGNSSGIVCSCCEGGHCGAGKRVCLLPMPVHNVLLIFRDETNYVERCHESVSCCSDGTVSRFCVFILSSGVHYARQQTTACVCNWCVCGLVWCSICRGIASIYKRWRPLWEEPLPI